MYILVKGLNADDNQYIIIFELLLPALDTVRRVIFDPEFSPCSIVKVLPCVKASAAENC